MGCGKLIIVIVGSRQEHGQEHGLWLDGIRDAGDLGQLGGAPAGGAVVDGEKVALENEGSRDASMLSAKVLSDRAATEDTYK